MAVNRREREKQQARKVNARDWAKQQSSGFEPTAVRLPDGLEWFKPKKGVQIVDVMPYLAGKRNRRADEGFQAFEFEYGVHRIPCLDGKRRWYCCPWDNFRKPCYTCNWVNNNPTKADKATLTAMRSSVRHLWVFNDKPGDLTNILKLYDSNHYNKGKGFGEQVGRSIEYWHTINPKADSCPFSDLQGGLRMSILWEEDTFPGGSPYLYAARIDFLPRDYDYPDDFISRVPCLDNLLIEVGSDVLKEAMEGGADDGEESNATHQSPDVEEPPTPPATTKTRSSKTETKTEPAPSSNGKPKSEPAKAQEPEPDDLDDDADLDDLDPDGEEEGEDEDFWSEEEGEEEASAKQTTKKVAGKK